MEEIWKPIDGYDGSYEVSNLGVVKSVGNNKKRKEKILKNNILMLKKANAYYPYKYVRLSKKCKTDFKYLHRLVAFYFIPNPENKPCVNHIDNNPSNNDISNLEWCTHKENVQHCMKQKRHVYWGYNTKTK